METLHNVETRKFCPLFVWFAIVDGALICWSMQDADVAIVGAGAAGMMTAIALGRELIAQRRTSRIVAVDGARSIGAKILVAGGGRCNVTHYEVDERAYAGSTPGGIRSVLRRLSVPDTISFFEGIGVQLKREETGKLFPTTDSARTVLSALTGEMTRVGVRLMHPWRVANIERDESAFVLRCAEEEREPIRASRVVLTTGGRALPKSGSDGHGYVLARGLGHTTTERIFPALVPLVVGEEARWLTELSGISTVARVEVRSGSGKRLAAFTNSILCTHFGLSGPGVLDVSRWLMDAKRSDDGARLVVNWLGDTLFDAVDQAVLSLGARSVGGWLRERLPERLALALCSRAGVEGSQPGHALTRESRRSLARVLTECEVQIVGDRGYTHAEVTAGGVPLSEVDVKTMRSRVCEGLSLAGEILDVDGRIGGFNFQWAWASGHVAGRALAEALAGCAHAD
jgi:predicted Rossmann fold flavoprotein